MSSSILPPFASSPGWRFSSLCAGALALLAVAACSRDEVPMGESDDEADFGRAELMASAAKLSEDSRSPAAYRRFVDEVEALRPRFNGRVADQAELKLTVMAQGPLEAYFDAAPGEQMEALATTVWPVALRVEPAEGESPEAYVRRICEDELAVECKHVVPEYWSVVLGAKVWDELGARAREAVQGCDSCTDESYDKVLADYDRFSVAIADRLAEVRPRADPAAWPTAVGGGEPWSTPLLLRITPDGEVSIDGEVVQRADWRHLVAERRDGSELLGLHLAPSATLGRLREVLATARQAGFGEVAIVARRSAFPYERREYRLAADPRALASAPLRDSDSLQLLVRHLGSRDRESEARATVDP